MSTPQSTKQLYRDAGRATLLGLVVNLGLGVVKLIGGLVGNSFALVSDAINSIGDSVTSTIILYALYVAQLPADEEHPYGHSRAEAIAASNVAVLIIVSALLVAWQAIARMPGRHELPAVWTLWIAATNFGLKEGLFQYKMRVGRRTGSSAVIANAWDHRSDAFCSLAVLVGLGLVHWGGAGLIWADQAAALFVAAAIIWSAARLFRQSASELMDLQADEAYVRQIEAAAAQVPGVLGIETLWVRKSGLEFFVDIHIEVDPHLTVEEGHRIGHAVKDHLLAEFVTLRDVLVHLEPFPHHRLA